MSRYLEYDEKKASLLSILTAWTNAGICMTMLAVALKVRR